MNALVTYDSSSDEEKHRRVSKGSFKGPDQIEHDEISHPATPPIQPNEFTTSSITANPVEGPVLGPILNPGSHADLSLEESQDDRYDSQRESTPSSPYTSQRNALRALSQSSFMSSSIPPSPPGSPNAAANAKVARFMELKGKGIHFNEDLAGKSSFRNPNLLVNLLERSGITESEQYASTLPKEIWDVTMFPHWSYKEGLMDQQREMNRELEADRKSQSATGRRKIAWTSGGQSTGSATSSNPNKRAR